MSKYNLINLFIEQKMQGHSELKKKKLPVNVFYKNSNINQINNGEHGEGNNINLNNDYGNNIEFDI